MFSASQRVCGVTALALAATLARAGCADAVTVRDAGGRNVEVKDASRIVSVGGAVTEILYALGLSDRIVAVDTTSLFPAEALKQKPNVGYMRALSAEGVLGLNPSLVLAIEGAGPKETIAVLEAATVPLVRVPDRYTGDGIVEKIKLVADVAGEHDRGECLAGKSRGRSRGADRAAREDHAAEEGAVRALAAQRQADGRGPQHRGRRHHPARRRRQRDRRL